MRNSLILLLTALLYSTFVFGQYQTTPYTPVKGSYTNTTPYETVHVKPIKGKKVKNVILMIGDGMGLVQASSAWVANHGKLNIDNCTYTGLARTWCADKLITDSAAAGSAMATGEKTNYHSLSVDSQGNPRTSLTDLAQAKGLKTGILVTCNLPDATPSAFCANNTDRGKDEEIAADYLNCGVDYILGAGRETYNKRTDKRDLLAEMKAKGYQVCTTWDETSKIQQGKIFSMLAEGQIPVAAERGDLFRKACMHSIRVLSQNKKGFFAMFEGSRIDDFGHSNDLPKHMEEIFDFDKLAGEVMKWAEKDGQTLVIILADHECGGLSLLDGDINTGSVTGMYTTRGHSGILVPVYAYGPGADKFTGIYENTEIFHKIVTLLKLKE